MSFQPPDLTIGGFDLGTNPAANTDQTQIAVAAPGPGRRVRVWALVYHANGVAHPAHNWMAAFQDSISGDRVRLSGAYPVGDQLVIPGGWALATNAALQVVFRASVAGPMFYRHTVFYTVERAA